MGRLRDDRPDAWSRLVYLYGIGFQLQGSWTDALDFSTWTHKYTASGAVTLKIGSVLGDIRLNTLGPTLAVTTNKGFWDSTLVGQYTGMTLAGLPLNLSDPASPFNQLVARTGLSAQTAGATFGLKLGSDLGCLGLPLNAAVPYLYFGASTGNSVQFGNSTVSTGGHSIALAVDVADPSVVGGYDDFRAGASWRGEIPYTPGSVAGRPGRPADLRQPLT